MVDLKELLKLTVTKKASDLHLTENSHPVLRIDGKLVLVKDHPVLKRDDLKRAIYSILTDLQKEHFERDLELDFSLALEEMERFRVNVHIQRGSVEAAFRRIPMEIPTLEELGLPPAIMDFSRKTKGLVLITGPTGSGKTTTLAAMIDVINRERACMITLIEDPIEYVHKNKKSVIKQREVHSDTRSFAESLKRCLRQDPDVIVVGEMRDLETIATALTAAETGHLVLATLHTQDAAQTIERIIDVFPAHQQQQILNQLASTLRAVIAQQLLPKVGGGRVAAREIMIHNSAIANLIRRNQMGQLYSVIQTSHKDGMITMNKAIDRLLQNNLISEDMAHNSKRNLETQASYY